MDSLSNLSDSPHKPVLLQETVSFADPKPGQTIIDATIGFAGHAEELINRIMPGGHYLGIDKDDQALEYSQKRLSKFGSGVKLAKGLFADLKLIASDNHISDADAIIFDLGVSSAQLDDPEYGLSFSSNKVLDMRIGMPDNQVTADQIINSWPQEDLRKLFLKNDQAQAAKLARIIIQARPIKSVIQLAQVISAAEIHKKPGVNPATKIFQALRITVNDEMPQLMGGLEQAVSLLKKGGKLLVISFHSGEDRVVKRFFRQEAKDCLCPAGTPICRCGHRARLRILTRKPIVPTLSEIEANKRCRSAKMRVAEKIV